MFQLHSAKSQIDQSFFVKSLKDAFIREGCSSFDLHAQQNVVELLLEVLTGPSIFTSAAYIVKSLTSTICHTCHQLNRTEDSLPILHLSVLRYFPTSFAKALEKESLPWFNAPYCYICSSVRESDSKLTLTSVEIEDEVFCTRKFNLAPVINDGGNLNSGHYTRLVKDGETWWDCSGKAVVQVNLDDINKSLPYVLLYQTKKFFICDFCVYLQGGLTDCNLRWLVSAKLFC